MRIRDMHPETLRHLASDLDRQAADARQEAQHSAGNTSMSCFWDGVAVRTKSLATGYRRKAARAEREQKKGRG